MGGVRGTGDEMRCSTTSEGKKWKARIGGYRCVTVELRRLRN